MRVTKPEAIGGAMWFAGCKDQLCLLRQKHSLIQILMQHSGKNRDKHLPLLTDKENWSTTSWLLCLHV